MAAIQDSPLSITASITGILTFIAAIIAFIYVRYSTLRNGRAEIATIVESVVATIEETQAIVQPKPATPPSDGFDETQGIFLHRSDNPDSSRLKKLVTELYSTELFILAQCMNVYGSTLRNMQLDARPIQSSSTTWDDVIQAVENVQKKWQPRRRYHSKVIENMKIWIHLIPGGSRSLTLSWLVISAVVMLGATPTMMRWYMVREKVLEKVQRREIIRSRLLFHQISVANSVAKNQATLVQHLADENAKIQSELTHLRSFTTYMDQSMRQLAYDNNEIKGLIHRLIAPANLHDKSPASTTSVASQVVPASPHDESTASTTSVTSEDD